MKKKTLTLELLHKIDAYWRAANYLSVGQLYLQDNPLLREPLKPTHVKSMLLGHWGTTPGQNFIYVHLNRVIKKYDLDMFYIAGPGHGGPALVGNTYLEGIYSEIYPNITQDELGLKKLFIQFSFPGGIPSHVSPECPGSIHEGGELGYSLSHAFGAVFEQVVNGGGHHILLFKPVARKKHPFYLQHIFFAGIDGVYFDAVVEDVFIVGL